MHRTQISLEDEQYELLMREAHRRSTSMSAIIRQIISNHFKTQVSGENALEEITGIAEGDGKPIGRDHNRYIYGGKKR